MGLFCLNSLVVHLFSCVVVYILVDIVNYNTTAAFVWGIVYYQWSKRYLRRRGLLILPEPVPPLQWVPKQQPGSVEEAPPPAEEQAAPLPEPQPEAAKPKLVTPVKLGAHPAEPAPAVPDASPVPAVSEIKIVRKSSILLKAFAVVMTLLFVAAMVCAVYLNSRLEDTQGELNQMTWLYKSLKSNSIAYSSYNALKADYDTLKGKYDSLWELSNETLED